MRTRVLSVWVVMGLLLSAAPITSASFTDVKSGITPYSEAILDLQSKGVIEGYKDEANQVSYKPEQKLNRAEYLKIVLESMGGEFSGSNCFPDVTTQWFAKYVCWAKETGIIAGYPDGLFKAGNDINFPEAAKILALAFEQEVTQDSPDWYEPFVRALETSQAIPLSIARMEQLVNRGEMAEMMWRLTEGVTDRPSKGYLNVKYPEVAINMATEEPQTATSCADLKAFTQEATRNYGYGGMLEDGAITGRPVMMRSQAVPEAADTSVGAGGANKSFSDTNLQVAGVDEADIIKTDGEYLYVVQQGHIYIIKAQPAGEMEQVAKISPANASSSISEIFLEGNRLIVLGTSWHDFYGMREPGLHASMIAPDYWGNSQSEVRIYYIGSRSDPVLERTILLDGNTVSSRRIGSKLYLVLNQGVGWYGPEPRPVPLETDLIPSFRDTMLDSLEIDKPMAFCDEVIILPRVRNPQFLSVAVIPTDNTEKAVETKVVLGNAQNIYMSLDNLYVAATHWQYHWRGGGSSSEKTSLYRFALTDDGVSFKAHGSVPGRILNQFSMDEHDGHFRIATTKGEVWQEDIPSQNNLYIMNLDLEQKAHIEGIAPGERIYSTRFVGDRIYMVTFKKVDPFFVIDTSNPLQPRILGKLKIPGYSDYLHPYDEDHIIGFGKDAVEAKDGDFAWYQGLKMALFDVTDPTNPTQLHTFAIGDRGSDSPLLHNHKALLFDKDRDLLAFPVQVNKLSGETDDDPWSEPDSAWGEAVFQGAYVFDIDLAKGFTLRGTISHYDTEDLKKLGGYFYGKNIERIVRIEDSLYTIGQAGVQAHSERDVDYQGEVKYDQSKPTTGDCPDPDAEGVTYTSEDPEVCAVIWFSCPEGTEGFSGTCGCGCKTTE